MVDNILASTTCPNNLNQSYTLLYQDTVCLTELLQLSHHCYAKQCLLNEQAFIGFLQLLVESIDAICQKNPHLPSDYHTYYLQFTHGIENTFWQDARTVNPF